MCCMAFTSDVSGGLTVMDTKGHLYPVEVKAEDLGNEQEDFPEQGDFPDDIGEGSDIDVSTRHP